MVRCALPEQLVQVQAQLGLGSIFSDYTQHRGVPSSPALAAPASFRLVRMEGTPRSHARGSSTDFDDISRRSHRPEPCPQPTGTSGALLSSDDYESRVVRDAG